MNTNTNLFVIEDENYKLVVKAKIGTMQSKKQLVGAKIRCR